MATSRKKHDDLPSAKSKPKASPVPQTNYPAAPHLVGVDWVELSVTSPSQTANTLIDLGMAPRGFVGQNPLVACGGLVLMLCQRPSESATPALSGITIQIVTDDIAKKHQQLQQLSLKISPIKRQVRGDMSFTWQSDEGFAIRLVGPVRD